LLCVVESVYLGNGSLRDKEEIQNSLSTARMGEFRQWSFGVTTRVKVEIAGAVLFFILGAIGLVVYIQEREDRIRADAAVSAQKAAFDQAAEQMKALQVADAKRDAQTAATIAQLTQAAAAQKTPQQIASWIPQQIPNLPQPITINVPKATPDNPTPNAIASIPQADLPKLRDTIEACQLNAVRVSACAADLASRDKQIEIFNKQTIPSLNNQIEDLQQELKGGTFWVRLKRAGKWVVFGAVAGGVALAVSGHVR
jgi:hypothetical protein